MACHCKEFSRAHLLRGAAAQAGQGLPRIEPGMPLPAGTGLNRRSFLLRGGALALSVYGAQRLGFGALEEGVAKAQAQSSSAPVLVSVFLDGGADSLSILAPTEDQTYRSLRPTLALPEGAGTAFSEDERLRWGPAAAALSELHGEGKVSVFPAIGYSSPDQSHFTSRHYWEVGALDAHARTGWMGRMLDVIGTPDNPMQGLSLDGWLSPALASARAPVAAIEGSGYELWAAGVWSEPEELMFNALGRVGAAAAAGDEPGLAAAGTVSQRVAMLREQLLPFSGGDGGIASPVGYPDGDFGSSLAGLAAMLDAGLPIRCAALSAVGGYDTHEGQADSFGDDLGRTLDSILAFQRDLEARRLDGRVMTLVWSEFGRRPEENGSLGTDHGAAGTAFLVGSRAAGQMIGEFPGLVELDPDDNIRSTSDFRAMYCSLLEQWFDVDAAAVMPGAAGFARPALVR